MNKMWILIWYIILMFFGVLITWFINKAVEVYFNLKEKQIRKKIARYKKYGRVYRYEGIFKDVIQVD